MEKITNTADFVEGGWAASVGACNELGFRPRIARVKTVYDDGALDLVLYSYTGERIGRESPAMGGPTGFEPYCHSELWEPIAKPDFNLLSDHHSSYGYQLKWLRPHPEYDEVA